jgi:uncharacterized protein (DUF2252 family)
MPSPSAFDLAARQIALDYEATRAFPALFARKRARMMVSPHAFLRGSAPLFYEVLAQHPDLAEGPKGTGFIVGDMHLENVGAYKTDEDAVVFNLNDFDDAAIAPQRLDVLRLSTSVLLAGRSFRCTGGEAIALAEGMLTDYVKAAWEPGSEAPPVPQPIADLIRNAGARSKKQLLDDRAPGDKGKRSFVRGERYVDLPKDVAAALPDLLKSYVKALGDRAPAHASEWSIEDAAFRVAGTGSLGTLRAAVLVREKSGDERIVEFKESRPTSVGALIGASASQGFSAEADRVAAAARGLVHDPARHLAWVEGANRSFIVRKLFPQEDKLGIDTFHAGPKLEGVVRFIGHLLGVAHARALKERPERPWTKDDVAPILDHAIELAGIFEAVYLAYARRSNR